MEIGFYPRQRWVIARSVDRCARPPMLCPATGPIDVAHLPLEQPSPDTDGSVLALCLGIGCDPKIRVPNELVVEIDPVERADVGFQNGRGGAIDIEQRLDISRAIHPGFALVSRTIRSSADSEADLSFQNIQHFQSVGILRGSRSA